MILLDPRLHNMTSVHKYKAKKIRNDLKNGPRSYPSMDNYTNSKSNATSVWAVNEDNLLSFVVEETRCIVRK